jgi:hypothetical protein
MKTSAAAIEDQGPSTSIVEFNQFESDLAEYKAKYQDVVYDLTVPAQEKQARSDRLSIGKKVAELDRVHAAVKAPLKAQVDLLDGERKRIKDGLLLIQDRIKSQIAEHDAKIQAIEDGLNARVDAIKALSIFEFQPTTANVQERLDTLNAITVDESFAHHAANALLAHKTSLSMLTVALAVATKAEADAAELERLRQESESRERQEREARIAAEATAKAEKAAALKAEQAEAARLDAIEQERIATERREANKKHCAKINNAAADAMVTATGISPEGARLVVSAIVKGSIPAVSIRY